jgi:hypothetical protein
MLEREAIEVALPHGNQSALQAIFFLMNMYSELHQEWSCVDDRPSANTYSIAS